ncbi:MAG: YeeE/YedE family protein [Rhodopseudomonas palustris]|nr:YeeE/YedE family protein [Rhodopseudomonas palustris]
MVAAAVVLAAFGGSFVVTNGWRSLLLWIIGLALRLCAVSRHVWFRGWFLAHCCAMAAPLMCAPQLLMIAAAALLFLPALDIGSVASQPVRGFVFPARYTAVALGAFLFGIGMQLGGGCASGALYTAGGESSPRMLITLAFMIAGATLAAFHADWWSALPAPAGAVAAEHIRSCRPVLALYALIGTLLWIAALEAAERRRHGTVRPIWQRHDEARSYGAWPYAWAALALALLNFATLAIAGRPWGVGQAFALWGSKALDATGLSGAGVPSGLLGAADPRRGAASLAVGRYHLDHGHRGDDRRAARGPASRHGSRRNGGSRPLMAAGLGDVLAGCCSASAPSSPPATLAISAMFSGIASGSLHGWLWLVSALLGNWLGLTLRPLFRLDQPPIAHRTVLQTT